MNTDHANQSEFHNAFVMRSFGEGQLLRTLLCNDMSFAIQVIIQDCAPDEGKSVGYADWFTEFKNTCKCCSPSLAQTQDVGWKNLTIALLKYIGILDILEVCGGWVTIE